MRKAQNRRFEIIKASILDYKTGTHFSVVLALNIFHHFLKQKETYHKLIEFLRSLKTDIIFFEPHLTNEQQMRGAYKNYNDSEFVEFILEHSMLKDSKFIGKDEDGRSVYMLHR